MTSRLVILINQPDVTGSNRSSLFLKDNLTSSVDDENSDKDQSFKKHLNCNLQVKCVFKTELFIVALETKTGLHFNL